MAIRIVIDILIAIGAIFALAGTIGILKMPDTYCRMQASTCVATLGTLCTSIGGVLYAAIIMNSASAAVKIAVIALMIILTNPLGAHAIAKGAYRNGIRPEKEMTVDDYGRDMKDE